MMKTNIHTHKLISGFFYLACLSPIHAKYSEPSSYSNPRKRVTLGEGRYNTSNYDDSGAFRNAINDVASAGGGRVFVPRGTYRVRGVQLKSNVHLEVQNGSTLIQHDSQPYGQIFYFTGTTRNVSIRGVGGRFNVRFPTTLNASGFFNPNNVINMKAENFNVFSSPKFERNNIGMGHIAGLPINRHFLLKNVTSTRNHFGFGIVQTGAAHDSDFNNLRGTGGVGLRLETGNNEPAKDGLDALDDIRCWNVVSVNGQNAIKLNPHKATSGFLWLGGLSSVGSLWTVITETGEGGHYDKVRLSTVKGTYGDSTRTGGGIASQWHKMSFYPRWIFGNKVFNSRGKGRYVPSVSVIGNYGTSIRNFSYTKLSSSGKYFLPQVTNRNHIFSALKDVGVEFLRRRPMMIESKDVGWWWE